MMIASCESCKSSVITKDWKATGFLHKNRPGLTYTMINQAQCAFGKDTQSDITFKQTHIAYQWSTFVCSTRFKCHSICSILPLPCHSVAQTPQSREPFAIYTMYFFNDIIQGSTTIKQNKCRCYNDMTFCYHSTTHPNLISILLHSLKSHSE